MTTTHIIAALCLFDVALGVLGTLLGVIYAGKAKAAFIRSQEHVHTLEARLADLRALHADCPNSDDLEVAIDQALEVAEPTTDLRRVR